MRSQYTVEITQVDNGFLVKCGCVALVYTEPARLLAVLEQWFDHPQETEKEYSARYKQERLQPAFPPPYRQYEETAKEAIPRDEAGAIRSGYEGDNAPPRTR